MTDTQKIDFKDVEIFSTGVFNGKKTTLADLQDAVKAYNDLGVMPDLKLTHEDTKTDRDKKYKFFENFPLVVGKIANLRLVGEKLIGDYINVLEPIKKMITDKLLITHSAEMYRDIKAKTTNTNYKAIFTAVALLPAGELPALFEVFKPYMYKLEELICQESAHIDIFNHEQKLIYVFSEEKNTMTEEQYKKAMKAYSGKGMTLLPYVKFSAMNAEEQKLYMDELTEDCSMPIKNSLEPDTNEISRLQAEVQKYKLEATQRAEVDAEAKYRAERDDLQAQLIKQDDEQKALKFQLQQIQADKNDEADKDFISKEVRAGKLAPSVQKYALDKLKEFRENESNSPVKLKYSVGDTTKDMCLTDSIKDFMSNILVKNQFATGEEFLPDNEILTADLKRKYSVDADPNSVLLQEQALKYGLDNKIDTNTTEGLIECLTAVGAYDSLVTSK